MVDALGGGTGEIHEDKVDCGDGRGGGCAGRNKVEVVLHLKAGVVARGCGDERGAWVMDETVLGFLLAGEASSKEAGIGMAFAFFAFYSAMGLILARRFGWGWSFALIECRTSAMFAFWYPFADSLEVVPGFADDGPLGALIIVTIALAFTCLIGLIARWVDQFAAHDLPAAKGESSARGLRKGRLMVSRRWLLLTQPRAPCASLDGGPPQLQCGAMIARNI
ncbi:hypothetical protein AB1Y20_014664 [Prymnesium parvum]|uniref:Uncharacterized protein n=1 Tax=Prymnesium parvum TaxID=97485 RepID=A0AB34IBG6_PRYPA